MIRNELTTTERVNRIGIGAVLIAVAMVAPTGPLGWLAVLPLIGTLPIFAGLFGVDYVSGFIRHEYHQILQSITHIHRGDHHHHHG